MDKERSMEFFERAFSSKTNGCYRHCACGVIHFDVSLENNWTWEKGELEELIEHSKREPLKYIQRDGSVSTLIIKNDEYVIGCICKSIEKTKSFIDMDRIKIIDYLNRDLQERIKEEERINDRLKTQLRHVRDLKENPKEEESPEEFL
jgi:hypothetical protein